MPISVNDWSPWMRALLATSDGGAAPDDAQAQATATPAQSSTAAPPAHRIEDDRTAGTRGTTPQGGNAITGSIASGQVTPLSDRVESAPPPNPLAQRISDTQGRLRQLGTAEAPQSLGDTVLPGKGFWRGLGRLAINAGAGGVGQGQRNEAFKNSLAERTRLQQEQGQDTRALSQQQVEDERIRSQENIADKRLATQNALEVQRERERDALQERLFGQQNQLESTRETQRRADEATREKEREASQGRLFAQQQSLERERESASDRRQENQFNLKGKVDVQKAVSNAEDIDTLDREQRKIMEQVGDNRFLNGPQSMQFLANHMALTVGRIKGARTGKDLIEAHIKARSLDQQLEGLASRVIAGGVLTKEQANQMLGTTGVKRYGAWKEVQDRAQDYNIDVNDRVPPEFGGRRGGAGGGGEEKTIDLTRPR